MPEIFFDFLSVWHRCIIFERDDINIQFADLMIEHILFLNVADESLLSYKTELLREVCVCPVF